MPAGAEASGALDVIYRFGGHHNGMGPREIAFDATGAITPSGSAYKFTTECYRERPLAAGSVARARTLWEAAERCSRSDRRCASILAGNGKADYDAFEPLWSLGGERHAPIEFKDRIGN